MDNRTMRKINAGLQIGIPVANLLGSLFQQIHAGQQRSAAEVAFQGWQAGNMRPSTATPAGSVEIDSPLSGKPVNIPTFETQPPRMGPVDSNALAQLYGAMSGVAPEYSKSYLDMGSQLYGVNAEDERYRTQRGDVLEDREYNRGITKEDREYNRGVASEDRGFQARAGVTGSLTGQHGRYDVNDPEAYLRYLLSGEGRIMDALGQRPEPLVPLGVIPGKGGVFIPTQQGTVLGGQSVRSDIPLRDPTVVSSGGSGSSGGAKMTDAEIRNLSTAYVERDSLAEQVAMIDQQVTALSEQMRTGPGFSKGRLQAQIAEIMLKKIALQGQLRMIETEIRARETGQVQRPGGGATQTTAPQNPY